MIVAGMKLRHVERFKDRQGKTRYYFRKGHGKRIPLPDPSDSGFIDAYRAALADDGRQGLGSALRTPGTFGRLVADYLQSPNFLRLKPSSQEVTRRIIERFAAEHGHRTVAGMTRDNVMTIIGRKSKTPAAANSLLKKLRVLIGFAIASKYRPDDPTIRIPFFKEGEHHTWTDAEIEQFEAHWPLGTLQRTAFALHLYAGQRRADVCHMLRNAIGESAISVVQQKTGTKLTIPMHAELTLALSKWPKKHLAVLTGPKGKAYTVESYGNLMADAIRDAGLPERCVLHGLRKAAARRLAEAGCTEKEIAAITGHKTLAEVARYTRAADQERLARAAIHRLGKRGKDI